MFDVAVGRGRLAFSVFFLWKGARRGRCLAPLPAPASPPHFGREGREIEASTGWCALGASQGYRPTIILFINFFFFVGSVCGFL